MNVVDDTLKIILNGKEFNARFDFGALAQVQENLSEIKKDMTCMEIISNILAGENLLTVSQVLVESIKRCHKDLTSEDVLEELKLLELDVIKAQTMVLVMKALPQTNSDSKKKAMKT